MRFGHCFNLAAAANGGDRRVLDLFLRARFDYAEPGLSSLAAATDAEFENTKALIREYGICTPVCNGMFPAEIRLTAQGVDFGQIEAYVDRAFARAREIGVEKVVLGSDKSRQLPDGYSQDAAYDEMIAAVRHMLPACETYGITIMIEPLRRPCNFINTLEDGMRVVRGVDHPKVKLLADTIHIMTSGEDLADILAYRDEILHVHVSDWNRALPAFGYSTELTGVLRTLKESGYDGTYSFEAHPPKDDFELQRSLILLKQKLGA